MRAVVRDVTTLKIRINMKQVMAKDRAYKYGYDQKDTGQAHYLFFQFGFTDEELQDALNVYRARAGSNAFASKKMNKAPHAEEKQVAFGVGNLFVLATWFIAQHKLSRLGSRLTLAIVIAYALSTTKYRLDEALITGKHGGMALSAERTQAFFALGLCNVSDTATTIPLIEIILFGARQVTPLVAGLSIADSSAAPHLLPTTQELVRNYDLARAKSLCAQLEREAACAAVPQSRAPNGGDMIVLDALSMQQSREAAALGEQAGLTVTTHFSTDQLPNACGYLAAAWACHLRSLGAAFAGMTAADAGAYNNAVHIMRQNALLGKFAHGDQAVWLTGEEIISLATEDNPDGPGTSPGWLSGPGPMNFWRTYFGRTLVNPAEQGRIHIMVVNSENAYTITEGASGVHWFLVAWRVNAACE